MLPATVALAAPTVEKQGQRTIITGDAYRLIFVGEATDFLLDLKGADGQWYATMKSPGVATFAYFHAGKEQSANGVRATWAVQPADNAVVVGQQVPLDPVSGAVLDLHWLCVPSGVLVGGRLALATPDDGQGVFWSPPRIALTPADWEGYLFWGPDGKPHEGRIADLAPPPAYAGVSPWGPQGDTVPSLDPQHPALIVRSKPGGSDLGVVYVGYPERWLGSHMFLQRHTENSLLLYNGYAPVARSETPLWAWLAPFARADAAVNAGRVEALAKEGAKLVEAFHPISQPVPEEWAKPLPDFPASLRRPEPVRDINEAVVFTINEDTASDYAMSLAQKVGSDCLVRAWFKWAQAPPVTQWRQYPPQIHQLGAIFGGGITCSALYDTENGITRDQLLDMATRGPAGQLLDAWDTAGIRHGSLSSPAYLDYLFRWCREQMDAGADYLFMDEHTAAIGGLEGYDDHSLADFRGYLLQECPQTKGWAADDVRWTNEFEVPLADRAICPTGKMESFDYRAYLKALNLLDKPAAPENPLATLWHQFRAWRDDRAWKTLTDRIRAYAKEHNRSVLISANGIAKYVDLQALGVWGQWNTKEGHIDLSEDQLLYWRGLVIRGQDVAGKRVPVVLFHDWGFGEVPFPWMAIAPSEREVWMRTRGAEIYAAGGFFAFPVLGPFNCDAGKDGTLPEIARQTAFYQAHRDLYLRSRYVGSEALRSSTKNLSLAAWWSDSPRGLVLHVINRNVTGGKLEPQENVTIELPVSAAPEKVAVISPDWGGETAATCRAAGAKLQVTLPRLEAYAVAMLQYPGAVDLARLKDPARTVPNSAWARPTRNEFTVLPDGRVEHADELGGCIQGMLHTQMRNPPTFVVNALSEGKLSMKVRAVAKIGRAHV
jgi:hypothetical protein